jgi:Rieske 2Fe-2S family protein
VSSLISTLPGRAYAATELFDEELRTVFGTSWLCVERAGALNAPGSFRTIQIGDENVLVVRDRDGSIKAMLNVCRHRGARVCAEAEGSVRRAFRCPYHAWTYGLDGALIAAPNLAEFTDVDRGDYGLARVHAREWLGYVWISLADDPPSFEQTVVAPANARFGDDETLSHYTLEALSVGATITYDVKANWKIIIENFYECYHCPTIHPELVEVLPEFQQGRATQWTAAAEGNYKGADFGAQIKGFTIDGQEGVTPLPDLAPELDRQYFGMTIRPQVIINLVPDHIIFHRLYPLAADHTIVVCDWLFNPAVIDNEEDTSRSVALFDRVNQQDMAVCERCQLGMKSRGYADGGVLVPVEHHISDFHDWVRARVPSLGAALAATSAAGQSGPQTHAEPALTS